MKLIVAFDRERDWNSNKVNPSIQRAFSELDPLFSFLAAHSLSRQRT